MAAPLLCKPSLNQIIAIVQKYQTAAIAAVNPALPTINEFHKGPKMRTEFPWLTVAYGGTIFVETSQQTREEHSEVIVGLESGNFDSELAQDQALDYMRMLDYIFNYLAGPPPSWVDWETALPIKHETVPSGMTTPFTTGSVKEIFIEREEQSISPVNEQQSEPVVKISLHLRFDVEEI